MVFEIYKNKLQNSPWKEKKNNLRNNGILKTERYENDLFNFKSYVIQLKSRGKCIAPEENVSTPEKLKIARPMIQIKAF